MFTFDNFKINERYFIRVEKEEGLNNFTAFVSNNFWNFLLNYRVRRPVTYFSSSEYLTSIKYILVG